MSNLGTGYVQIVPSAQGISRKITKALMPEASSAGNEAGKTIAQNLGNKLSSLGGKMIKGGAIATAVSVPIIKGIKSAMEAYEVQNAAETKLTEIYKTRMGATKAAAEATIKYAGELQKAGVVGDEVALSGAQQLATFAKMPGTVNKLLPAMEDLLVQQNGLNSTAENATGIANLMGKVLMGQTSALKRVGVTFSKEQEKVMKFGTEEEKAATLAQVITENVGHMNKAMLETPEGKIQQMKNSLGDLAEQVGAALAPAISELAQFVSAKIIPILEKVMSYAKRHPIIGKIAIGLTGLLAIGGPLSMMFGGILTKVGGFLAKGGSLAGIVGKLGGAFKVLTGPIGIAVSLFTLLWTKCEGFRDAVKELVGSALKTLKKTFKQLQPALKTIWDAISSIVKTIGKALVPIIKKLTPIIKTIIKIVGKVLTVVAKVVGTVIEKIAKVVNWIVDHLKPIVEKIGGWFSAAFETAKEIIQDVKDAIGKLVDKIKDAIDLLKELSGYGTASDKIKAAAEKMGITKHKHAKGGIVTRATNLGVNGGHSTIVGEAGPEAILPLKPFWTALDEALGTGTGTTYNIGDVTLDVSSLEDVATLEQFVTVIRRAKAFA